MKHISLLIHIHIPVNTVYRNESIMKTTCKPHLCCHIFWMQICFSNSKLPAQVFCTCHQSLGWPNCSCLALEMGQIWPASEGKGRGISPQHRLGSVYEAWKAAATRHSSCCWWWGNDRPCSSAWGTCFFHEHAVVVATHYYNSIIHGNLLADISCYKHCWYSMIHCGANCFPSENYCIWQSALQRDGVQIKLGTWISKKIDEFCMVLSIFVHDFPFQRDAFFRFFQVPAVSVADSWSSSSRSAGPRNPSAELLMDLWV